MDNTFYDSLSDKSREIAPQIEKLLNGISVKDAEDMLFQILSKIRASALVVA